jgi:hypothetical protein
MRPPFTEAGYVDTIRSIVDRGYVLRDFHEVDPSQRHLVLRHDVDQSIQIARRMAAIETENGWRSTWFVLMRTEMYNPWSLDAAANLRAMIADGHEIGLHLDAALYPDAAAMEAGAQAECAALEAITGAAVRIISFHRPAKHLVGNDSPVAGRPHAYMPRYMRDIAYCSDSRGQWHHGHPWDQPALIEGKAFQLLTHAVWWVGPNGRNARERLQDVLTAATTLLDAELSENNVVWRASS